MMAVCAIARDHLADLRHRRVVLALLLAAVLFSLALSLLLFGMSAFSEHTEFAGKLSEEERLQLALSVGMGTYMLQAAMYLLMFFVGSLLSLVTFCSLVSGERTRGSLPWVLSKPITRSQFLVGKWLGASAMVVMYAAVMSAILLGSTWFIEKSVPARVWHACVVMPFGFLLIGSVGAFLATVIPPAFGGVLAYFAGAQLFHRIAGWVAPWGWLQAPFTALYYLAPSYTKFNLCTDLVMGKDVPLPRVLLLAAYGLAYSLVMLILATAALRRRDMA